MTKRYRKLANNKHSIFVYLFIFVRTQEVFLYFLDVVPSAMHVGVFSGNDHLCTSLNDALCKTYLATYPTFKGRKLKFFWKIEWISVKVALRIYLHYSKVCAEILQNLHCFSVLFLFCQHT